MADRWFFDDDILRLVARALVKAAERAAHSQPVHDCRLLLLSDNLSMSALLQPGTIARLQTPDPDQTFCIDMRGAEHLNQHQTDTK